MYSLCTVFCLWKCKKWMSSFSHGLNEFIFCIVSQLRHGQLISYGSPLLIGITPSERRNARPNGSSGWALHLYQRQPKIRPRCFNASPCIRICCAPLLNQRIIFLIIFLILFSSFLYLCMYITENAL